ncbi:hypothetical protein TRVA0_018S00694 [Trichomonascus vanleenenianus]|uniref:putative ADP-ribose 1''-phosphate phosphatase n=1 Tax=Trichomonascus vanleenenianus TaxID=2268995 RepID=UPI003ECA1705
MLEKVVVRYLHRFCQSAPRNEFDFDVINYDPTKTFSDVMREHNVDTIVSPGNSYGFLNGGFDKVIVQYYCGLDYTAASTVEDIEYGLQTKLHEECHGYHPPESAMVVDMNKQLEIIGNSRSVPQLIHVPTMQLPQQLPKDSPLVYNCMWNMFRAVRANNRHPGNRQIKTILLPGLGTGYGGLSEEVCGKQMISAFKNFVTPRRAPMTFDVAQAEIDFLKRDYTESED